MRVLTILFLICFVLKAYPQFSIPDNTTQTIDFSSFTASGFQPSPSAGQLDSDEWAVTGFSDGDLAFGGTQTTSSTDYTRGSSSSSVTTGGVYAFDIGSGDVALGIQPTGSDFTPGTITLRIQNNTGSQIQELTLDYDLYYRNDQGRSSTYSFAHSADNSSYTTEGSLEFTTPTTQDALGWQSVSRSITLTGLTFSNGSFFFLRWTGVDAGGTGSRDEVGLDNIAVTAALDEETPPAFEGGDPAITGVTAIDFDLTSTLDEVGTTYYVVLNDGVSAPSSAQVVAGTDASNDPAIVSGSITNSAANSQFASSDISGFSDDASYDVYVVAQDDEGTANLQTTPVLLEFTAPELEKIVISEFMSNPSGTEPDLEWVEIHNYGASAIDLNGFTMTDDGTDNISVASGSFLIPSGAYVILTTDKTSFQNEWTGGSANSNVLQLGTGTFQLANSADEIVLNNADGKRVWRLAYDATDETEGRATFFDYSSNASIRDFGTSLDPGVVRNGNDDPGILGYEGNDFTTDSEVITGSSGDIASPIRGDYSVLLPVELMYFTATAKLGEAVLEWKTASEISNEGFHVEKSFDGVSFFKVGYVEGQGNSQVTTNYLFRDQYFDKNAYFRLQQVDYDGVSEYSPVIYLEKTLSSPTKIYPNPSHGQVFIASDKDSFHLKVKLLSGKALVDQSMTRKAAQKLLSELSSGLYLVYIVDSNYTFSQKLIRK